MKGMIIMKNHKKGDKLYINLISGPDDIRPISKTPAGDASKDPFCVYAHKRHAIGSKIINNDGSETVCTAHNNGSWQNINSIE